MMYPMTFPVASKALAQQVAGGGGEGGRSRPGPRPWPFGCGCWAGCDWANDDTANRVATTITWQIRMGRSLLLHRGSWNASGTVIRVSRVEGHGSCGVSIRLMEPSGSRV